METVMSFLTRKPHVFHWDGWLWYFFGWWMGKNSTPYDHEFIGIIHEFSREWWFLYSQRFQRNQYRNNQLELYRKASEKGPLVWKWGICETWGKTYWFPFYKLTRWKTQLFSILPHGWHAMGVYHGTIGSIKGVSQILTQHNECTKRNLLRGATSNGMSWTAKNEKLVTVKSHQNY